MVELKLEPVDFSIASDIYVSVRVGQSQKLTRATTHHSFKFPAQVVGSQKFGKVEIFRRIGSCSVGMLPRGDMDHEIDVPLVDDTTMKFKLNVASTSDMLMAPERESKGYDSKRRAASAYMETHNLEVRLAEVMQEVLREKPEDPAAFVGERLAKSAKTTVHTAKSQKSVNGGPSPRKGTPSKSSKSSFASPKGSPSKSSFSFEASNSVPPAPPSASATASLRPFSNYWKANFRQCSPAALAKFYASFHRAANGDSPEVSACPELVQPSIGLCSSSCQQSSTPEDLRQTMIGVLDAIPEASESGSRRPSLDSGSQSNSRAATAQEEKDFGLVWNSCVERVELPTSS